MKSSLTIITIVFSLVALNLTGQKIPAVYSNIEFNENGNLVYKYRDTTYAGIVHSPVYTIDDFTENITGSETGIAIQFKNSEFNGKLYYGLIHYNDSKHPLPVYFRSFLTIDNGYVHIDIKNQLGGRYDMIGWEKSGKGVIGYRIVDNEGNMIYHGRFAFSGTGPFSPTNVIIEGPFVDQITHNSAIISFTTLSPVKGQVLINERKATSKKADKYNEIFIDKLEPNKEYNYSITVDGIEQKYSFRTAPEPGSRSAFTFAYASDSRSGPGGGERTLYGANYYIMKKIMALANQQGAVFMQFTGDLIDGYLTNEQEIELQYANWKRAIEPWAHYMPVYEGMGNHEALTINFQIPGLYNGIQIDKFPFETNSAEAIFNRNFVNPTNGLISEDGAHYDPNDKTIDFPPYTENVYHYQYDNIAVICLNSDYLYAPSLSSLPHSSGNLHGYILDKQLEWLEEVITEYETNETVDHVFITQHTPAFPNGGHVHDDMWYNGNNQFRPWIAGKPLAKGIIERRDEYLDILVNKSEKVVAIFTGDEHNYCRTTISPGMPMYPETGYYSPRIDLSRTIYQINNGAAGAPYYAQQETPWTSHTEGFTTQNALVLIHIDGNRIELEVLNPDTLEEIDRLILKE